MSERKKCSLKSTKTRNKKMNNTKAKYLTNSEVQSTMKASEEMKAWQKWKHLKKYWWKTLKDSPKKQEILSLGLKSSISWNIFPFFELCKLFLKTKTQNIFQGFGFLNYKKKVENYKFEKYINFWKHI